MSLMRRSRGFSLTEILMAVGILGIGLTMVASIFPVAVDQTRRANHQELRCCTRQQASWPSRNREIRWETSYFPGVRRPAA
ncbi:MAG: prepilin-type N-terminal cleavage/methylation domain-containing protein, partial [Planctomycetota bacterium]|nr:prepilin-type N-terminal cleavage/methylation domain-containing protein [Planctomycetota bacterium]